MTDYPINRTPEHMRCTFTASCPSVHELEDGRLLIVGKTATDAELDVGDLAIGYDERAIVIDSALLENLLPEIFMRIQQKQVREHIRLLERVAELEARLEMDHVWREGPEDELVRVEIPPDERSFSGDGIECRDATIALQDERIKRMKGRISDLEQELGRHND